MSKDILITAKVETPRRELIERLAHQLELALDSPLGQPQPIGLTGLLEHLGAQLWDAAGLDPAKLADDLDAARDAQQPLRLVVTDPGTLAWPWETLYHGDDRLGFLARHPWCVVLRRLAGRGTNGPQCLPRPFRLLLLVASPEDLDAERSRLDYEQEEELLFTALDRPLARGEVVIDVAEDGCLETLWDRLRRNHYHAVILSMHGAMAHNALQQEEWGLLFEDARSGRGRPVAGSDLAAGFDELPGTRPGLVVLSACRTARLEESHGVIASVAQRLHTAGIERVLGMRLSVLDAAAAAFTAALFDRLIAGLSVGRALSLARRELASGDWVASASAGGKPRQDGPDAGRPRGDPFAQWALPVLLDRTADGPLLDLQRQVDLRPVPALAERIPGDGSLAMPQRAAFIGRRAQRRRHLRRFLEGQTPRLMLIGPGGVGKSSLMGWFTRETCERDPQVRVLGFRAPFDLNRLYNLVDAAFPGHERPQLPAAVQARGDIRERLAFLLQAWAARPAGPALFLLDNLETLQTLRPLAVREGCEDDLWFVQTVCALPAPTRVLLTGRYVLRELDGRVEIGAVPDAPYGDVLRRMSRLNWPADWDAPRKRWLYGVLGGNHRALEWLAVLLLHRPADADELVAALRRIEAPPDTPEAAVEVVLEAMRQNLLLGRLVAELPPLHQTLLFRAAAFRVPVTIDGLLVLADDADEAQVRAAAQDLADRSLLETSEDIDLDLRFYELPPIVRQLLSVGQLAKVPHAPSATVPHESCVSLGLDARFENQTRFLPPNLLPLLHARIARYHEFQGRHVTRRWQDDIEAVHHYRRADLHQDADRLAEDLAGFYYRLSDFAQARAITEPIVNRTTPPPPSWALNRCGMCQHALGQIDAALALYERSLAIVPDDRSRGTTLNNISQIYDARGDYEQALRFLQQSLLIRRQIGDKAGMTATLHNMASIALYQQQDLETALKDWGEALQLAMETRNAQGIFHVAGTLGRILGQLGQKDQARQLLEMAAAAGRQAGFPGVEELEDALRELKGER